MPAPVPDCWRCREYYVSHDPLRPHGCRAFGFTSVRLPRDEVRLASGNECLRFTPKPAAAAPEPPRRPD